MVPEHGQTGSFIRIPKRSGVVIPFALFGVLGTIIGVGQQAYSWYEARKAAAVEQDRRDRAIEDRLKKLERWKCVLGWDPGGVKGEATRNADRVCKGSEDQP